MSSRIKQVPAISSFIRVLAIGLTAAFVFVMIAAAACPVDLDQGTSTQHNHHNRHHSSTVHSSLCTWACQVNQSVSHTLSTIAVPFVLFLVILHSFVEQLKPTAPTRRHRSRSPPRSLLPR